jgi:hypothetical protein
MAWYLTSATVYDFDINHKLWVPFAEKATELERADLRWILPFPGNRAGSVKLTAYVAAPTAELAVHNLRQTVITAGVRAAEGTGLVVDWEQGPGEPTEHDGVPPAGVAPADKE